MEKLMMLMTLWIAGEACQMKEATSFNESMLNLPSTIKCDPPSPAFMIITALESLALTIVGVIYGKKNWPWRRRRGAQGEMN